MNSSTILEKPVRAGVFSSLQEADRAVETTLGCRVHEG